jgi:hypothetical protein
MHPQFNPQALLNKPLEISYWKDSIGEDAKIIDIGEDQYKITFEQAPEDDEQEDPYIWTTQEPESIEGDTAFFRNIGATNFWMREVKDEEQKLEYNNNMKTTVKELSEKLGVDTVYVNGFLQTLIKMGKASVVGKVEKPAGTRGKPSNIYEINEGIVD